MAKETPEWWQPGDSFDGYEVEAVIGEGGMGRVLRAHQISVDRKVAIKVLLPEGAEKPDMIARFLREGRAATKIRSRHVVTIHDVRSREGTPYMVMELLLGSPLDRFINEHGAMSISLAVEILLAVCDAVAAAHRMNVIHRDLKPGNIFLASAEDGTLEPKVVDFGISRVEGELIGGVKTKSQLILGTPAYLSPEQTRGSRHTSAQSDQYALGAILYECVTGMVAFPGTELYPLIHRIGRGEFAAPRTLNETIPPELELVILRAMAMEPATRFESVAAFAAALLPFASPEVRTRWSPVWGRDGSGGRASFAPETPAPEPQRAFDPVGSKPRSDSLPAPRVDEPTADRRSMVSGVALEVPALSMGPSWRTRLIVVGALLGALLMAAGVRLAMAPDATRGPAEYALRIEAFPPEATLSIDGRALGMGRVETRYPRNGVPHVLLVSAPGWVPQQITFVDAPPDGPIRLQRTPARGVAMADAGAPRTTPSATEVPVVPVVPVTTVIPPERHRPGSHHGHVDRTIPPRVPPAIQPGVPIAPPSVVGGDPSSGTNGASNR